MFHQTLLGRTTVLASTLAGLLLAGCNRNDDNTVNPPSTDKAGTGTNSGDHGFLAAPLTPSADQIKAMESLTVKPIPAIAPAERPALALQKSSAADVNVGFNDFGSLSQIADHASYTFADSYFQWVTSTAYAVVLPLSDGHYHLGYENANVCISGSNGFIPAGKYGLKSGYNCIVQGDAASQQRNLSPHEASQVIQFYIYDRVKIRTFDFKSFYLPPTSDLRYGHVQIWIHKIDVGWRYWADLPPATTGYTWFLPQTGVGGAQGIDEIRVQSPTPTGAYGWTIDNFMVNNVR